MRAPKAQAIFSLEILTNNKQNTITKFPFFTWFMMKFPDFLRNVHFHDCPWFEDGTLKFPDSPLFSLTLVTLFLCIYWGCSLKTEEPVSNELFCKISCLLLLRNLPCWLFQKPDQLWTFQIYYISRNKVYWIKIH